MSHINYSKQSLEDLKRVIKFLSSLDKQSANRAQKIILTEIQKITLMSTRFRVAKGAYKEREAIIKFGVSGYIVRFQCLPNDEILITRIKHQLENDY